MMNTEKVYLKAVYLAWARLGHFQEILKVVGVEHSTDANVIGCMNALRIYSENNWQVGVCKHKTEAAILGYDYLLTKLYVANGMKKPNDNMLKEELLEVITEPDTYCDDKNAALIRVAKETNALAEVLEEILQQTHDYTIT